VAKIDGMSSRRAAASFLVALVSACHGAPPVAETSVKPGINQEYLDPNLDVG
jgi:hypothetical protein